MSQRVQRVAEGIKQEIGKIIHGELKDPRIGFVTITKVDLSPDLRYASVYFSLLGTKKELRDTQVGLARSAGFIRKLLGRRMKLRYTPQVAFRLDEGVEYSIRISEVLEKIKNKGKSNEPESGN
ncbi:MAG: 30S ribosome-binding factor RbfA [Candidatus Omnitrophica bacterium]|nr:30S ribosome-binding factor RbfA [Candidatus Omnitrophota bacterium]MBU4141050.1 30S ribosome-binding factor RbfA [Candidatus Omnitrophota bacterium]